MTSPADAAPEAVEEALVAVHVERRRLLAVKRAQPLPRRPAALERHALLDDLHDVGVRLEVVDEAGGKRAMHCCQLLAVSYSLNSTTVTPPPPLLRRGGREIRDERVRPAETRRAPGAAARCRSRESAGRSARSADQRLVEELLGARQRLVDVAADHVQLA